MIFILLLATVITIIISTILIVITVYSITYLYDIDRSIDRFALPLVQL